MGYSYFNGRLTCDKCGGTSWVRKRRCPYRVRGDSLRGPRVTLPYCNAPALCQSCFEALGSLSAVHGEECRAGAESAQKHADEIEAQLDAGDALPVAAWDTGASVPEHRVGVLYRSRAGDSYRLMHADDYKWRPPLSAVETEPWEGPEKEGVPA